MKKHSLKDIRVKSFSTSLGDEGKNLMGGTGSRPINCIWIYTREAENADGGVTCG